MIECVLKCNLNTYKEIGVKLENEQWCEHVQKSVKYNDLTIGMIFLYG
jgi:hypothetical protein